MLQGAAKKLSPRVLPEQWQENQVIQCMETKGGKSLKKGVVSTERVNGVGVHIQSQ